MTDAKETDWVPNRPDKESEDPPRSMQRPFSTAQSTRRPSQERPVEGRRARYVFRTPFERPLGVSSGYLLLAGVVAVGFWILKNPIFLGFNSISAAYALVMGISAAALLAYHPAAYPWPQLASLAPILFFVSNRARFMSDLELSCYLLICFAGIFLVTFIAGARKRWIRITLEAGTLALWALAAFLKTSGLGLVSTVPTLSLLGVVASPFVAVIGVVVKRKRRQREIETKSEKERKERAKEELRALFGFDTRAGP